MQLEMLRNENKELEARLDDLTNKLHCQLPVCILREGERKKRKVGGRE